MPTMKYVYLVFAGIALTLPVRAATQIEETWGTYGGNGFFNWEYKDADAYGDARHRHDTERHRLFSNSPKHVIEIERLDLDKQWQIDPAKKRYTEESISAAREKARQDMEKTQQEWAKQEKKTSEEKPPKESDLRIRSAQTKVTGPGPIVTINGFTCRPYTVKTTIAFETVADHKLAGTQVYFQKQWTSDSPIFAQHEKDRDAYWHKALQGTESDKKEMKTLLESIKKELEKSDQEASIKAWKDYWTALEKIKGFPVRTLAGFSMTPTGVENTSKAVPETSKDDSLVQASDLSGGVGGLVGGIASRWASKKVEQKVAKKMTEHPVWVEEMTNEIDGATVGWGWMTEISGIKTLDSSTDLFDLPNGYKKVSSL